MSSPLDQLCNLYGVLPQYSDIWGNTRYTSEAAKRALLGAMGVAANNEEETAASLQAFQRRKWERAMPPVQVARESARPYRIPIAFPVTQDKLAYRWYLHRESGARDDGGFIPSQMEEMERHRPDDLGGQEFVERVLALDLPVEPGYHRFSIERAGGGDITAEMVFIVAPAACYKPPVIEGEGRVWGFALQLYGLRCERNYGIGILGICAA